MAQENNTTTMDRIDVALLGELARNGRATYVELAEKVGLTGTACARRLHALEENGVILRYQVVPNLKALGLTTTVIVRIALTSQSEEALQAFEQAIVKCASVVRCLLMSGSDDYLVTVVCRDIEDFEHIHKTQLSRLPRVSRIQSSTGRAASGCAEARAASSRMRASRGSRCTAQFAWASVSAAWGWSTRCRRKRASSP